MKYQKVDVPHDTKEGWCCACDYDIAVIKTNFISKSECKKLIQEENLAWLNHERCFTCGRKMKPSSTTDTCHQCWQEN